MPRPARLLARLAALALLAVALAGCGSSSGSSEPSTAGFEVVRGILAARGITLNDALSGDPGCDDPDLVPTAIRLNASGLDQPTPVRTYLYVFRNRASYDKLRPAVDACARSYVTNPEGYEAIDAPPFVLAGQGPWGPRFVDALRAGLTEASGAGG